MLQSIGELIENIISILWGLISIVNFIGGTLAYLLIWFYITFNELIPIIGRFFHLLYEDLKNFIDDINVNYVQTFKIVHHRLINIFNDVISIIEFIIDYTMNTYYLTIETIKWFFMQWIDLIYNIIISIRTVFILIGNSTWMLIMFVPNLIILFVTYILYVLNHFYHLMLTIIFFVISHIQNSINETINYFTEFPLKSLFGLVIFGLIVNFRRALFTVFCNIGQDLMWILLFAIEQFLYFADFVQNLFTIFYNRVTGMLRIHSRQQYSYASSSSDENNEYHDECERSSVNGNINDRCVICRDRRKTVLLMPCRHLCLCHRCATNLNNYRTVCPLCRKTYINTIQIYT